MGEGLTGEQPPKGDADGQPEYWPCDTHDEYDKGNTRGGYIVVVWLDY
jgi:hypothetical protein